MRAGNTLRMVAVQFAVLARALQATRLELLAVVILGGVTRPFPRHHTGFTTLVYTLPPVIFTDTHLAAVRLYVALLVVATVT